ncbi:MAG: TSUP family transporter [Planctomycetaceae bacterium]|nr:TSUP family transporter [Planctomycetaceae bacterium]
MWVIYPLLFLAGFIDAIAGGGGLISLSGYLAVGLPPHIAVATNKFSAFIGTGISAGMFVRGGHVKWDAALLSFTGAVIGSALGAKLVLLVDETTLAWILLLAIPLVAAFVLFRRDFGTSPRELPERRLRLLAFLVGFVIGGYDGFFGPGTGTFLIIAFTTVLGLDLLTACGNTKIVNFASNIAAVFTFIGSGHIDYRIGAPCAACFILGSLTGTRLAIKNGSRIIRPMIIVVITMLLIKVLVDLLS